MTSGTEKSLKINYSCMISMALSPSPIEQNTTSIMLHPEVVKSFDLLCLLNIYCNSNMPHYVTLPQYWQANIKHRQRQQECPEHSA